MSVTVTITLTDYQAALLLSDRVDNEVIDNETDILNLVEAQLEAVALFPIEDDGSQLVSFRLDADDAEWLYEVGERGFFNIHGRNGSILITCAQKAYEALPAGFKPELVVL